MNQSVAKKRKIDVNRLSILDLNDDCLLEIMKYIIAGCNSTYPSNLSKYANMENFAMAVESAKELLRIYHKEIYYHRELTEVANNDFLGINFSEIANKNEGDALCKLYANAISIDIEFCILSLDTSSYPEFPKHFEIVKRALENKNSLTELVLDFKGYPLDDLSHSFNNFEKLSSLTLDLRMSAETLVSVCQSAPHLRELKIMSTDIQGRLSDIVPHCSKLRYLTFEPKPNVDGSEYSPLIEHPHLWVITIHGAYKNGSLLSMFQAMKDCRRDEASELTVNFTDVLPLSGSVTIARADSMKFLSNALEHSSDRIELTTCYDFFEISRDSRPIEESLTTINLCAASFKVTWYWKRLNLERCLVSDIDNLITLLKQFNVNNLTIDLFDSKRVFRKLFKTLKPDGLFGLKSIIIDDEDKDTGAKQLINKLATRQLVKIKTITFLKCSFADWESVGLLSELTNLQTLIIRIKRHFEKTYARELCNLLNTCSVCTYIDCYDWSIEFQKNAWIPGSTSNGVNTLKILDGMKSLNELLEALAYRNFNANEELCISSYNLDFQNIHKVSEIKTLKKLSIQILNANGIEKLSELTELEELTMEITEKDSLIKLFDRLGSKESPTLQSLKLRLVQLWHNEVSMISRIRSLKKLNLFVCGAASCASLTELANSNIEELEISVPRLSLVKLLAAFAKRRTARLLRLKTYNYKKSNPLDRMELTELSKHQDLSTLDLLNFDSKTLPYLLHLKNLKKLVINSMIGFKECKCLVKLTNLESLTVSLNESNGLPVLCKLKSLKELIIEEKSISLGRAYNKACEDDLKLELLSVPITYEDELQGITRMKSLKKLFIHFSPNIYSLTLPIEQGQLTDLEFLYIKPEYINFELWLFILESCKNISTCTIEGFFDTRDYSLRKVHTLIKSIRDPEIQKPLLLTMIVLTLFEPENDAFDVEYIDDAYLKVVYSFNLKYTIF